MSEEDFDYQRQQEEERRRQEEEYQYPAEYLAECRATRIWNQAWANWANKE